MMQSFTPPYTILCSENTRRLRKRISGHLAILGTPEYHAVYGLWSRGVIPGMPLSPDPFDLTVSKRQWEVGVQTWRSELQRLAWVYSTATEHQ